ncbi:MAG: DUF2288 family protein [Merismopediaceae bacterium]|nr:DUF2288 family protein [Merismopediaceae bacterium]
MTDIKHQLTEELAPMDWETLMPHAKRDAIIVIDPALDLIDVGVAIAEDQANLVQNWISELLIHKPSQEELSHWNDNVGQEFLTLIVQPFVLIKPMA